MQISIIPNVESQFQSDEKISLFSFLPENTVFWLKDWDIIEEEVNKQNADLDAFISKKQQSSTEHTEFEDDPDESKILKDLNRYNMQSAINKNAQKILSFKPFIIKRPPSKKVILLPVSLTLYSSFGKSSSDRF